MRAGNAQPQLFDVAELISGHLRICALAHRSVLFQNLLCSFLSKTREQRETLILRIKNLEEQRRLLTEELNKWELQIQSIHQRLSKEGYAQQFALKKSAAGHQQQSHSMSSPLQRSSVLATPSSALSPASLNLISRLSAGSITAAAASGASVLSTSPTGGLASGPSSGSLISTSVGTTSLSKSTGSVTAGTTATAASNSISAPASPATAAAAGPAFAPTVTAAASASDLAAMLQGKEPGRFRSASDVSSSSQPRSGPSYNLIKQKYFQSLNLAPQTRAVVPLSSSSAAGSNRDLSSYGGRTRSSSASTAAHHLPGASGAAGGHQRFALDSLDIDRVGARPAGGPSLRTPLTSLPSMLSNLNAATAAATSASTVGSPPIPLLQSSPSHPQSASPSTSPPSSTSASPSPPATSGGMNASSTDVMLVDNDSLTAAPLGGANHAAAAGNRLERTPSPSPPLSASPPSGIGPAPVSVAAAGLSESPQSHSIPIPGASTTVSAHRNSAGSLGAATDHSPHRHSLSSSHHSLSSSPTSRSRERSGSGNSQAVASPPPPPGWEAEVEKLRVGLEEFEDAEQQRQQTWAKLESLLDCREYFKAELSELEQQLLQKYNLAAVPADKTSS